MFLKMFSKCEYKNPADDQLVIAFVHADQDAVVDDVDEREEERVVEHLCSLLKNREIAIDLSEGNILN